MKDELSSWTEVRDFECECESLNATLLPLPDQSYSLNTAFKQWTVNDILGHLNFWNELADTALHAPKNFEERISKIREAAEHGNLLKYERASRNGLDGTQLREKWFQGSKRLVATFAAADPSTRVPWVGPSMAARSKIVSRQMETWAHGQAVYDLLGESREVHKRIRNIAHLGVKTFPWTFSNRGLSVPENRPYVSLDSPDGEIWEWGQPDTSERIEGRVEEFCQVVTQVRHIDDTNLQTTGDIARWWMKIAQCFAGPPENPPQPGTRFRKKRT